MSQLFPRLKSSLRRFFVVLSLAANSSVVAAPTAEERDEPIPYWELSQRDARSYRAQGLRNEGYHVATSRSTFRALWNRMHIDFDQTPRAVKLPYVDFSREMVIVLSAGRHSSGNTTLSIARVSQRNGSIFVHAHIGTAGGGCMVTQAVNTPTVILRIEASAQPVKVYWERSSHNCR